MSRWRESKAWPILTRKTFTLRFLLTFSEIRDFRKVCSVEDSGGRLPISCIYTAQVRPFVRRGVLCAICIYTLLA